MPLTVGLKSKTHWLSQCFGRTFWEDLQLCLSRVRSYIQLSFLGWTTSLNSYAEHVFHLSSCLLCTICRTGGLVPFRLPDSDLSTGFILIASSNSGNRASVRLHRDGECWMGWRYGLFFCSLHLCWEGLGQRQDVTLSAEELGLVLDMIVTGHEKLHKDLWIRNWWPYN